MKNIKTTYCLDCRFDRKSDEMIKQGNRMVCKYCIARKKPPTRVKR